MVFGSWEIFNLGKPHKRLLCAQLATYRFDGIVTAHDNGVKKREYIELFCFRLVFTISASVEYTHWNFKGIEVIEIFAKNFVTL